MGEKDWTAFITVVKEGNISKAAEKLFLSQPALSYRIKQIEDSLGNPLFLRTNGGILLTPQGELYYNYCGEMLKEQIALKEKMDNLSGEIQGTIKIASSINFADYELPVLLNAFTRLYPRVHVQVKTGFSEQVRKLFNSGEYMIAFARGSENLPGKGLKLLEEPYCLAYYKKVTHKDLIDIPFISYTSDSTIAHAIENWCKENLNILPRPSMELDSMSTCRHFVREGLGWAILPYMGLGDFRDETTYLEKLKQADGRPLTRTTSMLYDDSTLHLSAIKAFHAFVENYYRDRSYTDIGDREHALKLSK